MISTPAAHVARDAVAPGRHVLRAVGARPDVRDTDNRMPHIIDVVKATVTLGGSADGFQPRAPRNRPAPP
ncbi:hypothetical protein [Longimicrobium sp.]|uniref:hypothetical protein n=1 Tax=Longimicrobium sp. TaxID=2029185 RepID=UPI003B3BA2DB